MPDTVAGGVSAANAAKGVTVENAAQRLLERWNANESGDDPNASIGLGSDAAGEPQDVDTGYPDDPGPEDDDTGTVDTDDDDLDEAPGAGDESPPTWTLATLLEAAGVSAADVKGVIQVNGETREVTLEEALTGYQLRSDYDRNNAALREQQAQFEAHVQQRTAEVDQLLQVATLATQQDMQALQQQHQQWLQSAEASQLRANPATAGEWAARDAEYRTAIFEQQSRQQQLVQQIQQLRYQQQQQVQAKLHEQLAVERRKLNSYVPAWVDDQAYRLGVAEVHEYVMRSYGVPEERLRINDAVTIDLFRKAMLYDQLQEKVPETKRKARQQHPTLRPGGQQRSQTAGERTEADLRAQLKKSGKSADAVELFKHRDKLRSRRTRRRR